MCFLHSHHGYYFITEYSCFRVREARIQHSGIVLAGVVTLPIECNSSEPASLSIKWPIKLLAVNGELENFYFFLKGRRAGKNKTHELGRVRGRVGPVKPHGDGMASGNFKNSQCLVSPVKVSIPIIQSSRSLFSIRIN